MNHDEDCHGSVDRCNFINVDVQPTKQEILEQAEHIGIDTESESHLLWIAEKSWHSDLPHPWVPLEDEKQRLYFYNPITKTSMWDHPHDDLYRNMVQQERTGRLSRFTNSSPEDSGIAGITASSMRSTPLQPLAQSMRSKPALPKHLSTDLMSPKLDIQSQNEPKASVRLKNLNDKPSMSTSTPLSTEIGKRSFLKKDRPKSADKNTKKEAEDDKTPSDLVDTKESLKVKFNLDLDELSDASHYSYVETEPSVETGDLDLLDASDLVQQTETMMAMMANKRPSVVPKINANNEPRHSSNSQSSDGSQSNPIGKIERDNSMYQLNINQLANEQNALLEEHNKVMKQQKEQFIAAETECKADLDKKLADLRLQNASLLQTEKDMLMDNLHMQMQHLENDEKSRLMQDMQSRLEAVRLANEHQTAQLKHQLATQLDSMKKQHEKMVANQKANLEEIMAEQNQQMEQCQHDHNQAMLAVKEKLKTELLHTKNRLENEHQREIEGIKEQQQLEITKLQNSNSIKKAESQLLEDEALKAVSDKLSGLKMAVENETLMLEELKKKRLLLEHQQSMLESTKELYDKTIKTDTMHPKVHGCCHANSHECCQLHKSNTDTQHHMHNNNFNKILEPVFDELRTINKKLNNLQDDNMSSYSKVSNQKDKHSKKESQMPEDVPVIANSLLDVSSQLTDLLQEFKNEQVVSDVSHSVPPFSLSPLLSFHSGSDVNQTLLSPFKDQMSLSSSFTHEPGSYTSMHYPYNKSLMSTSRLSASLPRQSTKQQLDAQKKWLQNFYKQRSSTHHI